MRAEEGQAEGGQAEGGQAEGGQAEGGQAGGAGDDAWQDEWRARLECWWLGLPLPTQTQLRGCMGALSLHLGSRADAAWRAAQRSLAPFAPTPLKPMTPLTTPTSAAPVAAPVAAAVAEVGCEWLGERIELPHLPAVPKQMRWPPIPRLIPQMLPSRQQLLSLDRSPALDPALDQSLALDQRPALEQRPETLDQRLSLDPIRPAFDHLATLAHRQSVGDALSTPFGHEAPSSGVGLASHLVAVGAGGLVAGGLVALAGLACRARSRRARKPGRLGLRSVAAGAGPRQPGEAGIVR